MQLVGDLLRQTAERDPDDNRADLFGRSAVNRYYYAVFLAALHMFREVNQREAAISHKDFPITLRGRFKKRMLRELREKRRDRLITERQKESLKNALIGATSELANLLEYAYRLRVIADYEPEVLTVKGNGGCSLDGTSLVAASRWRDRATVHVGKVMRVWRELGH